MTKIARVTVTTVMIIDHVSYIVEQSHKSFAIHTVNHDWTIANSICSIQYDLQIARAGWQWHYIAVDYGPRVTITKACRRAATGACVPHTAHRGRCYDGSINQSINQIRQHTDHTRTALIFIIYHMLRNVKLPPAAAIR